MEPKLFRYRLFTQPFLFVFFALAFFLPLSIADSVDHTFEKPLQEHILPREDTSSSHITIQVIDSIKFHNFDWSNNTQILRHKHGYISYHNYTLRDDGFGRQQAHWTKRELTEVHPHFAELQRRGFTADPDPRNGGKWNFALHSPSCPLPIPLCFVDVASNVRLVATVQQGIQLWHNALGPARGVQFNLDIFRICSDPSVPSFAVNIRYLPGATHATIGYRKPRPGSATLEDRGRHYIDFDPALWPTTLVASVMAHELGHILGLEHEHQRFDAPNYVTFNCMNLRDYQTVRLRLLQEDIRLPNSQRRATIDDLCTDPQLASFYGFSASALAPYRPEAMDVFGNPITEQMHGAFDRDSIMFYDSSQGRRSGAGPVLTWADGSLIHFSGVISQGDIATVKALYPDIT